MTVLCAILGVVCLMLLIRLVYQRHLILKVQKQVDFLAARDTQTEIMLEKTDKTIGNLVTGINRLLDKYRNTGQQIERNDMLLRDTITSLSHDLRTPLATANGYIQLLQERELPAEQQEYLNIAEERINAVKLLLDQLFEFARIELSELKLNCKTVDVHSVLRDVAASYYSDFEGKGCIPEIKIPSSPAVIWADPDALTRIFANVIYNALVHGEGNYKITAVQENGNSIITVSNSSKSIRQEDIPYLFDRFYTTDQSRTKKTTGLGLAIAQKLISRMNGRISAGLLNEIIEIQMVLPVTHI